MDDEIAALIKEDKYKEALVLIETELEKDPMDYFFRNFHG